LSDNYRVIFNSSHTYSLHTAIDLYIPKQYNKNKYLDDKQFLETAQKNATQLKFK